MKDNDDSCQEDFLGFESFVIYAYWYVMIGPNLAIQRDRLHYDI